MYAEIPRISAVKKSYTKKPVKNIFTIETSIIEKNKYPPNFTCSLCSSSLAGFLIRNRSRNTTDVTIYIKVTFVPNLIPVPIRLAKYTIAIGIPALTAAATKAIPKGAIRILSVFPNLISDIINVKI